MIPSYIYHYFIPNSLRNRQLAIYDQLCTVVIAYVVATALLIILPSILLLFSPLAGYYYVLCGICIYTLFHIKITGRFMFPLAVTMLTGYAVIIRNCLQSGGILSIQTSALYLLLLTGFWADRRVGKTMLFSNLLALFILALNSLDHTVYPENAYVPERIEVAFVYHISITIFFGVFFWMVYQQYDEAKLQVRQQQRKQIDSLNKAVEERTSQLSTMRQTLARDFHDETGNILSAITQQAGILRLKAGHDENLKPLIDNIIENSEHLYSASRDFLWSINHNSDDMEAVLAYLTAFGQHYYNQFDVAFSAHIPAANQYVHKRIAPFLTRHIIYIFKEAMTNAAKHSGASEIVFDVELSHNHFRLLLEDNGRWKIPDQSTQHSGLANMRKRSTENGLTFNIAYNKTGTRVQVEVPTTQDNSTKHTQLT